MSHQLRRLLLMGLVAAPVFAAGGCSYLEQFFIINSSAKPLVVVAGATAYSHAQTGERICSWVWQGSAERQVFSLPSARLGRNYVGSGDLTKVADVSFDDSSCSL